MSARAALLINCSKAQAAAVRERAELERRTVSGYVLNIVLRAVALEETVFARVSRLRPLPFRRPPGPRTCVLIRCSADEAKRIRSATNRRQMTNCGYVLYCLERWWRLERGATIRHASRAAAEDVAS
jgi:hypothetical protein